MTAATLVSFLLLHILVSILASTPGGIQAVHSPTKPSVPAAKILTSSNSKRSSYGHIYVSGSSERLEFFRSIFGSLIPCEAMPIAFGEGIYEFGCPPAHVEAFKLDTNMRGFNESAPLRELHMFNGTVTYPSHYRGALLVVKRGECSFLAKAAFAQQAGASGLAIIGGKGTLTRFGFNVTHPFEVAIAEKIKIPVVLASSKLEKYRTPPCEAPVVEEVLSTSNATTTNLLDSSKSGTAEIEVEIVDEIALLEKERAFNQTLNEKIIASFNETEEFNFNYSMSFEESEALLAERREKMLTQLKEEEEEKLHQEYIDSTLEFIDSENRKVELKDPNFQCMFWGFMKAQLDVCEASEAPFPLFSLSNQLRELREEQERLRMGIVDEEEYALMLGDDEDLEDFAIAGDITAIGSPAWLEYHNITDPDDEEAILEAILRTQEEEKQRQNANNEADDGNASALESVYIPRNKRKLLSANLSGFNPFLLSKGDFSIYDVSDEQATASDNLWNYIRDVQKKLQQFEKAPSTTATVHVVWSLSQSGADLSSIHTTKSAYTLEPRHFLQPVSSPDTKVRLLHPSEISEETAASPLYMEKHELEDGNVTEISIPEPLEGVMEGGLALFGGPIRESMVSPVALADPIDACSPLLNHPSQTKGRYILTLRGVCTLHEKARIAQQAGALGLLIVNIEQVDCEDKLQRLVKTISNPENAEIDIEEVSIDPMGQLPQANGADSRRAAWNDRIKEICNLHVSQPIDDGKEEDILAKIQARDAYNLRVQKERERAERRNATYVEPEKPEGYDEDLKELTPVIISTVLVPKAYEDLFLKYSEPARHSETPSEASGPFLHVSLVASTAQSNGWIDLLHLAAEGSRNILTDQYYTHKFLLDRLNEHHPFSISNSGSLGRYKLLTFLADLFGYHTHREGQQNDYTPWTLALWDWALGVAQGSATGSPDFLNRFEHVGLSLPNPFTLLKHMEPYFQELSSSVEGPLRCRIESSQSYTFPIAEFELNSASNIQISHRLVQLLSYQACLEKHAFHNAAVIGKYLKMYRQDHTAPEWERVGIALFTPYNVPKDNVSQLMQMYMMAGELSNVTDEKAKKREQLSRLRDIILQ